MIFASVFGELGDYLNDQLIKDAALAHANQVMDVFRRPGARRLYEFVRLDDQPFDAPGGRLIVPGHAIESMWFMIHIFQRHGDEARVRQAIDCIRWHLELGWDKEYGGIVRAIDPEGLPPWNVLTDGKIWWVHTETLYALLLAYSICKEQWCLDWFQRVHDYSFSHFPVPEYGEWIQNLDRQGNKANTSVALPVKDPFHLARSLIYSVGVLEELAGKSDADKRRDLHRTSRCRCERSIIDCVCKSKSSIFKVNARSIAWAIRFASKKDSSW